MTRPRATSVDAQGSADGFVPGTGFWADMLPDGNTRLIVSVDADALPAAHRALVASLEPPLAFLYRREIDRTGPEPARAKPRDFVALELPHERVEAATTACAGLVYEDARAEVWIRGQFGETVVLDRDGILFCYPDDPLYRDALARLGVPERRVPTVSERDYVKHWFYPDHDRMEEELRTRLGLDEVAHRR